MNANFQQYHSNSEWYNNILYLQQENYKQTNAHQQQSTAFMQNTCMGKGRVDLRTTGVKADITF